jgi:hypothetical protein
VFLGGKQILEKRFLNYKTSVEDNMSFAITKDLMSIIKKKKLELTTHCLVKEKISLGS